MLWQSSIELIILDACNQNIEYNWALRHPNILLIQSDLVTSHNFTHCTWLYSLFCMIIVDQNNEYDQAFSHHNNVFDWMDNCCLPKQCTIEFHHIIAMYGHFVLDKQTSKPYEIQVALCSQGPEPLPSSPSLIMLHHLLLPPHHPPDTLLMKLVTEPTPACFCTKKLECCEGNNLLPSNISHTCLSVWLLVCVYIPCLSEFGHDHVFVNGYDSGLFAMCSEGNNLLPSKIWHKISECLTLCTSLYYWIWAWLCIC